MCYGQTGAGKTFTMTGSTESYQNRGLIPRAISQLFKEISNRRDCTINVRSANITFMLEGRLCIFEKILVNFLRYFILSLCRISSFFSLFFLMNQMAV